MLEEDEEKTSHRGESSFYEQKEPASLASKAVFLINLSHLVRYLRRTWYRRQLENLFFHERESYWRELNRTGT